MKNFYKKISVSTGLFLLFFVLTFNSFAQPAPVVETIWRDTSIIPTHTRTSLVFPTNPPDSTQVEGGYFNSYFNNMFANLCPDGEVLAGFNPGAIDDSSPYKINTRGKLVCKSISSSDGLASGFTGSLVGSGNVFPIYNNDGTGLNNSILSQTRIDNQDGIKVDGTLTVNQDDDNSAFVAHFGRKNSANQFQGLSIFSYVPDRNRNSNLANNDFLSGASMLYSGLASKNFHITSADENSEMRFVVGNFSDPNKVKLKLTKNGLIYPQGAGSGKVLTSDVNGLASWKNIGDILGDTINNIISDYKPCRAGGYLSECYGEGAKADGWGTVSIGNGAGSGSTGEANVFVGKESGRNVSGRGNTFVGLHAGRNISGSNNIGIGSNINFSGSGSRNIVMGEGWSFYELNGFGNIFIGQHLSHNALDLYNFNAGRNISGANNIVIGSAPRNYYNSNGNGGTLKDVNIDMTKDNQFNFAWTLFGKDTGTNNAKVGINTNNPTANLTISGSIQIKDGTQGSGKILVSDANGLARWETASLSGNPNDCSATNKSVNGHNYPIIGLTNGNSFLSNYIETITGGSRQWSQRFKCEKGYIITEGSEINSLVCNNGYVSNGSACIQPSNDSKLGCSAMTMNINGREYSIPAIAHNFSAYAYSSSNIDNGHINYKQLFACNNGTITTSGTEEATSTTCSAGFGWNGNSCILSNNIEVTHAYSGTTCNTANIQVVNITPGIDKIPENLNADTMYKLEGGIYDITKKINFNTCSAIVGAGTGATTVQYSGLSYGSESLISSVKRDNIISNLKLSGKKQDNPGKAKHIISGSGSNRILRNLYLDNSTDYAIYGGVNLKASNIYFQDTDGGIYADNGTIENSSFHNFKNTKNDSYFNFLKKGNIINGLSFSSGSSIYVLKIDGADNVLNNVDFENITGTVLISSGENTISSGIFAKNIKLKNRDHLGLFVFGGKSKISNISIYDVLGDGTNNNALIILLSNNSALNNVLVGRLNLLTTYTYSSIIRSYGGNVSLNNFMANDIKYYRKGLFDFGSSTNSYINNVILSNINNMSGDDCVDFTGNNSIINNFIVSSTSKCGFSISGNNNTIKNFLSYKNRLHGIVLNGSNNTFSNVYSYANGGVGITGNGNSNFYYDKLQVFGNGGANNVGPLNRGLASHWLSGFNDGNFSDNSSFSTNWAISPTNVSGFNINTVGYQTGLTWPDKVDWSFGSSIPNQISPIIPSTCNLSTTSTIKCRPEFGGTDTYNSLKKIGEW